MSYLVDIALEIWTVTQQMAPYLLLGFLMAGVLSVFISPELVEAHLGKRGLWQVCKAALLGVPLPLCSCGVIPVTASLYRHGASKGAALSFLASTPQTGLDSIMVTHALLGPVFMLFRIVTAFVSGILGGTLVELITPVGEDHNGRREGECSCCGGHKKGNRLVRAFRYGFGVLARDVGRGMLLGIVLSGLLSALVPENYFADKLTPGLGAMCIMMIVGIPIYTCSAGSVPIALALMHMGVSPGAALVFLVAGPATNAATVVTVWKLLGKGVTVVYLAAIGGCALAAGYVLDLVVTAPEILAPTHAHHGMTWVNRVAALVLIPVLLQSLLPGRPASHTSGKAAAPAGGGES